MAHLRVGFFSDSYHPYVSGVVRSMDSFTQALTQLGHRVYTFAPSYPGYEEDTDTVYRVPSMPIRRYPGLRLAFPYGSPVIWGGGPDVDVVHVHSPFAMGHAGALYARRLRVPLVLTVHSIYEEYVRYAPFMGRKMERTWGATSKLAVRSYLLNYANGCNAVVAPSHYVAGLLAEWGVEVPVYVVPTGVATDFSLEADGAPLRQRLGLAADTPVWLAVGRVAPEKRLDVVLQAFAAFHRQMSQCSGTPPVLLVVGDGPASSTLQAQAASMGLAEQVRFLGAVPGEELPGWYRSADLLVHAGESETQGLVLAEAISCGLPVLTVNDGALAETVVPEESGLVVPRQVPTMAQAAYRYFCEPGLRQRLRAGCHRQAARLGALAAAERLAAVYDQTLAETMTMPVDS